jgi:hypoxanthine phosphoribosyltransferase
MTTDRVISLWDAETIHDKVQALGQQLEKDFKGSDPLILSLLGGSLIFVADLIRAIKQPVRFEFVQVQYSPGGLDGEVRDIHYPMPLTIEDQRLVVIKDVSASGVPESYLADQFLQHGARDVEFAVLIDIPSERKTDFKADYSCFSVERQGLFVGYGLKHGGQYGNLPYLGRIADRVGGI